MHAAVKDWPMVQTGKPANPIIQATFSSGNGLMRPLEAAANKAGVQIVLEHKMTAIYRQTPSSGPVLGMAVDNNGTKLNIRARKAVIIGTGGSTGNVNFRRMFDPRLTEEYCGLAGMPWSNQDASGELAAMAVGASLWGFYNQTGEFGSNVTKPGTIGCQYNYRNLQWMPGSAVFNRARASGLRVDNWQDVILVNMLGQRFYDETGDQFIANDYKSIDPYVPAIISMPRTWTISPTTGLMPPWPALATGTMVAARFGQSSTLTLSPARNGIRRLRMLMSTPASFSGRTRSAISPRKS
jgi:hypothetical protein